MPAVMVSMGAVMAKALPGLLKLPVSTRNQKAFAAIGTGLALSMIGANFLGKKNAEGLALGAISSGVGVFLDQFLPAQFKGLSEEGQLITEAEIDQEIRELADGGVALGPFGADVTTLEGLGIEDEEISDAEIETI